MRWAVKCGSNGYILRLSEKKFIGVLSVPDASLISFDEFFVQFDLVGVLGIQATDGLTEVSRIEIYHWLIRMLPSKLITRWSTLSTLHTVLELTFPLLRD